MNNDDLKKAYTRIIDIEEWKEDEEEQIWHASRYNYQDMLINVMLYLKQTGGLEFAILKDPELGQWWTDRVKKIEKAEKKVAALEKLKSTMSAEELKLLGIKL